jgi:septal ring-binding cell division protein DamX
MKIEVRKEEVRSQKSEYRSSYLKVRSLIYSDFPALPARLPESYGGQAGRYILTSIFLILNTACVAQKDKPYYEDLSSLRPKVSLEEAKSKDSAAIKKNIVMVTPTHTVNTKVDVILDSIDRFNLTRKFVDGYTIQIYSGQKRDEALNASKRLAESSTNLKANTQYQQPKFKVTVGKYYSRLEAQKDLLRLKRVFSSAILVPERIMIK